MIFVSYAEKLKVIHGKEASVKDGFYLEKVFYELWKASLLAISRLTVDKLW